LCNNSAQLKAVSKLFVTDLRISAKNYVQGMLFFKLCIVWNVALCCATMFANACFIFK